MGTAEISALDEHVNENRYGYISGNGYCDGYGNGYGCENGYGNGNGDGDGNGFGEENENVYGYADKLGRKHPGNSGNI